MLGTIIFALFWILLYGMAWFGRKWFQHNNFKLSAYSVVGLCVLLFCLAGVVILGPIIYGYRNTEAAINEYANRNNKIVVEYYLCNENGVRLDYRSRDSALNRMFLIHWRYRVIFGKGSDKIVTIGQPFFGEFLGNVTAVKDVGEG